MRKTLAIVSVGVSIFVAVSLVFTAGGAPEFDTAKALEKLHELIPDHEITVTREEILVGEYLVKKEGIFKIVVGKLPETQHEIESISHKAEAFIEKFSDLPDFDRIWREFPLTGIGYGIGYVSVGVETLSERFEISVDLFYVLQNASKTIGVGVPGKDIPIFFFESGPIVLRSRTDRYRPVLDPYNAVT